MAATAKVMDEYTTAELLGRIEERTRHTTNSLSTLDRKMDDLGTRVAVVEQHIESFSPVKKLVFAVVGLIVTALVMAVLALVIQQPR